MRSPFQSARLLYRAIEPSDARFMNDIVSDASGALSRIHLQSNSANLRPASKKSILALQDYLLEKALVAVIICLPVPHSPPFSTFNKAKPDPSEIQECAPTPIGCLFITRVHLGQSNSRNARLGIDLIPQHQGKGYGIEAVSWILNWSFQIAGLHRVGVECFEWNYSARGLCQKLGFVSEGRKREALWFDGRWWDTFEYGILENEWRQKGGIIKLV